MFCFPYSLNNNTTPNTAPSPYTWPDNSIAKWHPVIFRISRPTFATLTENIFTLFWKPKSLELSVFPEVDFSNEIFFHLLHYPQHILIPPKFWERKFVDRNYFFSLSFFLLSASFSTKLHQTVLLPIHGVTSAFFNYCYCTCIYNYRYTVVFLLLCWDNKVVSATRIHLFVIANFAGMDREGGSNGSCYYSVLGIRKESSFSDIRTAYRKLALVFFNFFFRLWIFWFPNEFSLQSLKFWRRKRVNFTNEIEVYFMYLLRNGIRTGGRRIRRWPEKLNGGFRRFKRHIQVKIL